MKKIIPKNEDEILVSLALIRRYIESFFEHSYNKRSEFSFTIIENNIFLFIESLNGSIENKINLNIDRLDLSNLYILLYEFIKDKYLNSKFETINLQEIIDLASKDTVLSLNVRDVHRNVIKIEFKDLGLEKEMIEKIKGDWLNLIETKKTSKTI